MSELVANSGRTFKSYELLPPELRTLIIDEMAADDKAKFCRCSKRANIEAKHSKKFVFGLEFHGYAADALEIEVVHGEYEMFDDKVHGFLWKFNEVDGKKSMDCTTLEEKPLWSMDLDASIDLVEYAVNHFKDYLKKYQKTVKKLFINDLFKQLGKRDIEYDLELRSLSNLRELKIHDCAGLEQILSKIRHPLKLLEVVGAEISQLLPQCPNLYEVSKVLLACECRLNYQQLKQLTAERCEIHIGDLSEEEIFEFIDEWKNDPLEKKTLGYYRWDMKNSGFSAVRLFQLLHSEFDGSATKTLNIKNNKDFRKTADVYYNNNGAVLDKKYLSFKGL